MSKDPVCGMSVDDKSPYTSTLAGQTYVFCSATCKAKFDQEPARYATPVAGTSPPGGKP